MKPKILLFDLETAPAIAAVWGKWEQNAVWFLEHEYLLMFSYKWLGEKETYAYGLPDFPSWKRNKKDDKALVKKLWEVLNEADIVIAHNGNSFDVKMSNTFFVSRGLKPVSMYRSVDTKLEAKRYFRFKSNSLDDLGDFLGLGRKLETGGKDLWKSCMAGDPEAWDTMRKYNIQDVELLEQVYLKLLPWMKTHPNLAMYSEEKELRCPNCNSDSYTKRGYNYYATGKRQSYVCSCGRRFEDRLTIKSMVATR